MTNIEKTIRGRTYEDFNIGMILKHQMGRTITDVDNIWFTLLTCNANEGHFNKDYCEKNYSEPPFNGRMFVNAALTFAIVAGVSVEDTSKNGVMLGLTNMKLPNPVFAGDTLYAESEVISVRESKSHPEAGLVTIKTRGYKQDGTLVIEFERTFLTLKRNQTWKGDVSKRKPRTNRENSHQRFS
jgi:itaconyl-CoA hydratase